MTFSKVSAPPASGNASIVFLNKMEFGVTAGDVYMSVIISYDCATNANELYYTEDNTTFHLFEGDLESETSVYFGGPTEEDPSRCQVFLSFLDNVTPDLNPDEFITSFIFFLAENVMSPTVPPLVTEAPTDSPTGSPV